MAVISTVFLCNTSLYAQDSSKKAPKAYSKEQIAKQNILTLFRWIEDGNLEKAEVRKVIVVIKEQLKVLKKECALDKASCPEVYRCFDNNFFNTLIKGYKFEADNLPLLNRLFTETAAGKTNATKPRHPWLDIKNNLIDCLENELIISCAITTKTDLSKPEILVATDIASIADLMEGTLTSTLKTKLKLSGDYRLIHKGSTSRGTSFDNTDFDFDLLFEKQAVLDGFFKKLTPIMNLLSRKWRSSGYDIFNKNERDVSKRRLINLLVKDKDGIILQIQLLVGKKSRVYVDILNAQIEQIKALGGSWEYLSGQIIIFKRLVRDVLHSYGKYCGGLDGVRCEQFIVQAGSVSDYGKKITGIGSFDKTMRWIYSIGFNRTSSTIIPFDIATQQTGIYIYPGDNLMKVCSSSFWNQLVNASRKYVELTKIEMSEDEFASLGHNREN